MSTPNPNAGLMGLTQPAMAQAATMTPLGAEKDPVPAGQTFDPLSIFGGHTGPGYITSNKPAPVVAAPAFSLPNPFRTDLPPTLDPHYFATALTASIMASITGGVVRLNSDPNSGGMEPVLVVDFFNGKGLVSKTWNAAQLYLYYQKHAGFTVGV